MQDQLVRIRPQIDRINKELNEKEYRYTATRYFERVNRRIDFSSFPPLTKETAKDIAKVEERILNAPDYFELHETYTAYELKMLIGIKHALLESVRENGNTIPENIKGEIEELFRNPKLRNEMKEENISDIKAYFVKAFTSAREGSYEVNLKAFDHILRKFVAKSQSE